MPESTIQLVFHPGLAPRVSNISPLQGSYSLCRTQVVLRMVGMCLSFSFSFFCIRSIYGNWELRIYPPGRSNGSSRTVKYWDLCNLPTLFMPTTYPLFSLPHVQRPRRGLNRLASFSFMPDPGRVTVWFKVVSPFPNALGTASKVLPPERLKPLFTLSIWYRLYLPDLREINLWFPCVKFVANPSQVYGLAQGSFYV